MDGPFQCALLPLPYIPVMTIQRQGFPAVLFVALATALVQSRQGPFRARRWRSPEQVGRLDQQARRIEAERAGGERMSHDRSIGGPRMMGHSACVRVDIEIVVNAC